MKEKLHILLKNTQNLKNRDCVITRPLRLARIFILYIRKNCFEKTVFSYIENGSVPILGF